MKNILILACVFFSLSLSALESFVVANSKDGTKVHLKLYGTGDKVIVLVHGGPGLPGELRPLGEKLAETNQIVEMYLRIYSKSETNGPYTARAYATDIAETISFIESRPDLFGKKEIILFGHSWGCLPVLEYLKTSQDTRVVKSILSGPAPMELATNARFYGTLFARASLRKPLTAAKFSLYSAQLTKIAKSGDDEKYNQKYREVSALLLDGHFPHKPDFNFPEVEDIKVNDDNGVNVYSQTTIEDIKAMRNKTYLNGLSSIQIPIVHIHGNQDAIPSKPAVNAFSSKLKPELYKFIQYQGTHFPWVESELVFQNYLKILKNEIK